MVAQNLLTVIAIFFLGVPSALAQGDHIATLVKVEGEVKLLQDPAPTAKSEKNQALYNGKYYTFRMAKLGTKVRRGDVVQTGNNAKAKIVYENGDQIILAPSSSYRALSTKEDRTVIDLFFGKIRSVVRPKGPRENMVVRSRSLAMGVRGTDFFVADPDEKGRAAIVVVRGKIEAMPTGLEAKPVEVPAGYVVSTAPAGSTPNDKKEAPKPLAVERSTKTELLEVQKSSLLAKTTPEAMKDLTPDLQKEIVDLEKESVEATIQDIKAADPELFERAKIDVTKVEDVEQLLTISVKQAFDEAPAGAKDSKPSEQDLKDLNEDVYKKYFKTE
ncbi:MAG: FecR domain-containing protein [Oligoflexales bacterium]